MSLQPGTRLGAYEILSTLGAGGMGIVYRARDTRLGREVAIKILPERWLTDAERRSRFDREARVLASLNHPNIGAIYGIEETTDARALVLELIPGPTLADWLKDGPLAPREALRIAVQIASALEAAHERGIVHRDLKPANVILAGAGRSPAARAAGGAAHRDSGPRSAPTVKVLDFGLAKEVFAAAASDDPTAAAPLAQEATREGVLVGTLAYMSPEQARGDAIDERTDVWAFGCVLYEMLTGRALFGGASLPDTLAAIVTREPDWNALPAQTPQDVRRLLRRSLEKDRRERLRDVHDLRLALEDAASEPDAVPASELPSERHRQRPPTRLLGMVAVAILLTGAILGAIGARYWAGRGDLAAPAGFEKRLEIATPPTEEPASFAVSPDGTRLVFVASNEGKSRLWLRPLASTVARPLGGTEGATFPFWSPDGRAVAFFADHSLKRIDLEPGSVQVLAHADGGRGGSWGPDGTIVFQPTALVGLGNLVHVAATGGEVTPYESLMGYFPQFLPDGRHFLYWGLSDNSIESRWGVCVAAQDGSGAKRLLESDGSAVYSSDHLLFVRGDTLLAQRFDPATLTLSGSASPVAGDVRAHYVGVSPVASTADGPIVYRTGTIGVLRQFVWVDRGGREVATAGEPLLDPGIPDLSPDGRSVAFSRMIDQKLHLWLLDLTRGVAERLTSDPSHESSATWSPDGKRIAYCSSGALVVRSLDENTLVRLVEEKEGGCPADWSRDGRFLLYTSGSRARGSSKTWVLPLDPPGERIAFAQSAFLTVDARFSPDGKWISYTSDESGRPEVYLGRFPGPLRKQQVSTAGGGMAKWRGDGRELFYVALDGKLMSVPLDPAAGGDSIDVRTPVPLFDAKVGPAFQANNTHLFMVAADGQRFLMLRIVEQTAAPLTVLLDWRPSAAPAAP